MAMSETGPILIQLIGGELDGDSFRLVADGSVQPPGQFVYMSVHRPTNESCWMIYGVPIMGVIANWPPASPEGQEETLTRYDCHFWGKWSLDFSRKLV